MWEAFPKVGSGNTAVLQAQADFYIAQAEEYQPWADIVKAYTVPKPAAVVTTFVGLGARNDGTYDASIAKPVVDAGWACLTEAYYCESENWTPDRLDFTATKRLGFPRTQPVIGLWKGRRGRIPATYYIDNLRLGAYPGYSVWLTETMTDADWAALEVFNKGG